MSNLLNLILRDPRLMRITQEELSVALDLPLTFVPFATLQKWIQYVSDNTSDARLSHLLNSIDNHSFYEPENLAIAIRYIARHRAVLEDNKYPVFTAEHPIFMMLRSNPDYYILEALFMTLNAIRAGDEIHSNVVKMPLSTTTTTGKSTLSIATVPINELHGYMIAGPAFISDAMYREAKTLKERITSPLTPLLRFFLTESEAARAFNYLDTRAIITTPDLNRRLVVIKEMIEALARVTAPDFNPTPTIIRDVLQSIFPIIHSIRNRNMKSGTAYRRSYPIYESSDAGELKQSTRWLQLTIRLHTNQIHGEIRFAEAPMKPLVHSGMREDISRFWDGSHTKRVSLRLESMLVFRNWIFDFTGDPHLNNDGKFRDRFHSFIETTQSADIKANIIAGLSCFWLTRLLGADVICYHQLDHSKDQFRTIGRFASETENIAWARRNSSMLGTLTAEERTEHWLHKVSREARPFAYVCGSEDSRGGVYCSRNDFYRAHGLKAPQSVLAIPVCHGGRAFGVFECVSFGPFAFDTASRALLDDFTALVSSFKMTQAIPTLIDAVRSHTLITRVGAPPAKQFDVMAEAIARHFLCYSVSIWTVDPYDSNVFRLSGSHNRSDGGYLVRSVVAQYRKNDQDSVSATVGTRGEIWTTGEIGKFPFNEKWLTKEHRADLAKSGVKHLAIIPVRTPEGRMIASVTLAARHSAFPEEWRPQASLLSQILSAALNDNSLIERIVLDGISDVAHEMHSLSTRLKNASKRLKARIPKQIQSGKPEGQLVESELIRLSLDDLDEYLEQMSRVVDILQPKAFIDLHSNPHFRGSALLAHMVKTISIENLRIREVWNAEISNRSEDMKSKRLKRSEDTWPSGALQVLGDRALLRIVMSNIIENAVKYSPEGGAIEWGSKIESGNGECSVWIGNFGPAITSEERRRLFDRRIRGVRAIATGAPGRGEGLYQAKILMRAMQGRISYSSNEGRLSNGLPWHVFRITLPLTTRVE